MRRINAWFDVSCGILNRYRSSIASVIACAIVIGVASTALAAPASDDAAEIFKVNCSGCHGPEGRATSPAAKLLKVRSLLSPEVQKKSDADLYAITAKGTKNMLPFEKKLGREKIRAVISYLRELSKKK